MDEGAIRLTAAFGSVECLQLLIDANCNRPMDKVATYLAERNGHHQCVALLKSI